MLEMITYREMPREPKPENISAGPDHLKGARNMTYWPVGRWKTRPTAAPFQEN